MKKTILTAITILSVFGLSACGNVQKSDKEVSGVTTTTSASVVTTVTTPSATTVDEVTTTSDTTVTTEPTTKTETTTTPIVTTSATETTTIATTKTTTTTKKATTTTKKATTTTTTAPKKTEKATTTTTAEKKVQLTQSDIDRLVKELQEYSNSKCDFDNFFYTTDEMWERISCTDITNGSWGTPRTISLYSELLQFYPIPMSYESLSNMIKEDIDYMYSHHVKGGHIVVYQNWCPNGEAINSYGSPAWEIYLIY